MTSRCRFPWSIRSSPTTVSPARIAIQDNNKSGQFLGQEYDLVEDLLPADGDVAAKAKEILKDGIIASPDGADGRRSQRFRIFE